MKKKLKYIITLFFTFLFIFVSSIFISKNYYLFFKTYINGFNQSNENINNVKKIQEQYFFRIRYDDKNYDDFYIKDLPFTNNINQNIDYIYQKQNILNYFQEKQVNLSFNFINLKKSDIDSFIENIEHLQSSIKSENAYISNKDMNYIIVPEVNGTEINKDLFANDLFDLLNQKFNYDFENFLLFEINLDKYYIKPDINKDNIILNKKINDLNKYINLNIQYVFGSDIETVPKEELFKWISLTNEQDDNYKIEVNYDYVLKYIEKLAEKYNTKGHSRKFKTSNNEEISITKGDYGYSISQTKEATQLIQDILNGENVKKEPLYLYKGYIRNSINDDIGNTYIEIDIEKQHLWMYKNSQLIIDSDIVTGNISKGNGTPVGIYGLTYKQKNAILKGQGYASPVSYWMPFNGNIGLHDATWRNKFGGNIYKTNGSHGCVNLPKDVAKIIFENIEKNMPIILY